MGSNSLWTNIVQENKIKRAEMLLAAENSLEVQGLLLEKCRRDPVFWINHFCWTFNPNLGNPHLPFLLYPKQERLVRILDKCLNRARSGEKVSLVIDKPRNVGATFTFMVWCLHHFLFDEFSARVGSRKEDYVDKYGDKDTLFYKIDYQLERLPGWMVPKNILSERTSMNLAYPGKSNVISGESANPNFGRGGRRSCIMFDELAFWEYSQSAWQTAGESSNFRVAMSTPPEEGKENFFYKLLTGQKGKVEVFQFDWQDVPTRDEKWFKNAKETKSEEEFAREIMKSFDATVEGRVYANDLKFVKFTDIDYNPLLPLYVAWDFGLDTVAMIWIQKDFRTNKVYVIDAYSNLNKSIDYFVPFITGTIISGKYYDYSDFELDMITRHKEWSMDITHFGDPNVKGRHVATGESTKSILEDKFGIYIQSKDWGGRRWTDIRDITKPVFRRLEINQNRGAFLTEALMSSVYPKKRVSSQSQSEPLKPVHNNSSHFRSAFEYFCDNEPSFYFGNNTIMELEDNYFDPFSVI